MNDFELALMEAAKGTFLDYERLTGGWWLMHGPESFLQNGMALRLKKRDGISVYPECSPARVKLDHNVVKVGRPPKTNQQQRFDLVTWWRNGSPRAIVEIKLANSMPPVIKDAEKLMAYSKEARGVFRNGYLMVYSEAGRNIARNQQIAGKKRLATRFDNWRDGVAPTGFKEIKRFIKEPREEIDGHVWSYGFVLYKMKFED